MKFTSVILILSLALTSFSQNEPDYTHRMLNRSLKKQGFEGTSALKELNSKTIQAQTGALGKLFTVKNPKSQSELQYVYVGRVHSCRTGGCSKPGTANDELSSEYFDYFILFSNKPAVLEVKVFNYQATHGHEVSARGWLKQFTGYKGETNLRPGKEIDAISGATISVSGITRDIVTKTKILKSHNQ